MAPIALTYFGRLPFRSLQDCSASLQLRLRGSWWIQSWEWLSQSWGQRTVWEEEKERTPVCHSLSIVATVVNNGKMVQRRIQMIF